MIDEYSMVSLSMLAKINLRLSAICSNTDADFGGLSVILVGDINQLPPVGEKPLYAEEARNEHETTGRTLIQSFSEVFFLDVPQRQRNDRQFFDVLNAVAEGNVNAAQYGLIRSRFACLPVPLLPDEDRTLLTASNDAADRYNKMILRSMQSATNPIAIIPSHGKYKERTKATGSWKMLQKIFLARNAKVRKCL